MQTQTPTLAPPTRSRFRRPWLWIGGFLLVLVAAPFVMSWISNWMTDREIEAICREIDAEDPHWRWEEMVARQPKSPPAHEDATVQLNKVVEMLRATPFTPAKTVPLAGPKTTSNTRLSEKDIKIVRAEFAKLGAGVLDEARKLKKLSKGHIRLDDETGVGAEKGRDLLKMLPVCQLLAYDALLLAHESSDFDRAAESCLATLNAAAVPGDHPTMMSQLIRLAGATQGAQVVERVIGQGDISAATLHGLQAALDRAAAHNGSYPAMRGERVFVQGFYQRVRSGETTYSRELGIPPAQRDLHMRLVDAFPGVQIRQMPEELRLIGDLINASKKSDVEKLQTFRTIQARGPSTGRVFLLKSAMPFVAGQMISMAADEAYIRCAASAVAAERFRLEHDRWPTGFAELVKVGLLREPYKDPFDGQPLRWRLTNTGLVIYSIGQNEIDDGAKLDANQNIVATSDVGVVLWNPMLRRAAAPEK